MIIFMIHEISKKNSFEKKQISLYIENHIILFHSDLFSTKKTIVKKYIKFVAYRFLENALHPHPSSFNFFPLSSQIFDPQRKIKRDVFNRIAK
jgi:hypothetical protein